MDDNSFGKMAEQMQNMISDGAMGKIKMPPPVFVELGGEITDVDIDAKTMTVKFPVEDRFRNPLGFLQGGILVAMIDNTVGPLSFMLAPPSVTTQFNTSYLRPVTPQDTFLTIKAVCIEQTRRQLFLQGTAYNMEGKTLCIAQATQQVVENR